MKQKFLDSSINLITKYQTYTEKDIEKLKYGLEGLYLTLTKTIILFILALILGIFWEVLAIMILFNILRYFGFGFHAEKSWQCMIISTINFILIPLCFIKVDINTIATIIISLVCLIGFLLYAPADTVKRPLKNKKKRLYRKLLTCLVGIIYMILAILFPVIRDYLLCAMVIEFIVINPFLYKIMKQPYNNFKN